MGRVLGSPIDLGTSRKYTVFAEGNKVFQIEAQRTQDNEFGFKTNTIEVYKDGICKLQIQDVQNCFASQYF